jgi:hypothetical protein
LNASTVAALDVADKTGRAALALEDSNERILPANPLKKDPDTMFLISIAKPS